MIIKNAMKNLGRNKGRTILIFITAGVLMLASACSMVVHISAKQLAEKQMQKIGAQVIVTRNDEKLMKLTDLSGYREISIRQLKSFSESSLLKKSELYASAVGKTSLKTVEGSGLSNGSGIQGDHEGNSDANASENGASYGGNETSGGNSTNESGGKEAMEVNPNEVEIAQPNNAQGSQEEAVTGGTSFQSNANEYGGLSLESPNVLVIGSTNQKINDDFSEGLRKIKAGSIYKKAGEVLISEELANKNKLNVGDKFSVKLIDLGSGGEVPTLNLTISGIFEDHKPAGEADAGNLNKSNELLVDYKTFEQLKSADSTSGGVSVEGSFQLKNPDDVNALTKEFYKKGMPEFYELSINRNAYEKSVAPIKQVEDMTQLFSIVILGSGALIMIALSLLSIRERKYEIGVLRSMGLKKSKISLMLCIETCTICILCAILALGIAKLAAQPLADMMLASSDAAQSVQFGAFFVGSGSAEVITNIPADLSMSAIALILCSALVLGLVSSAGGVLYVTRNEPMRILAERN